MLKALHFRLMLWAGKRLFSYVAVYAPGGDEGEVKALHFAVSEAALMQSVLELTEDASARP